MTKCAGCREPLEHIAAIRVYHGQCDPQGRVEMLERALRDLVSMFDNHPYLPCEDGELPALDRARTAVDYKPAQLKGREPA